MMCDCKVLAALVVFLCVVQLGMCAVDWRRNLPAELDNGLEWYPSSQDDRSIYDVLRLQKLIADEANAGPRVQYFPSFYRPNAGLRDQPDAAYVLPYQENIVATRPLSKPSKRNSLHDLLKSLRIQGSGRYKPMRFGAGVGKK